MPRALGLMVVSAAGLLACPVARAPGQDGKDALSRLLKAVQAHKEPERGSLFAFPRAVKILEAGPKNYKGEISFRGLHTYSTNLDENKLVKEFGRPDEAGVENITVTGKAGLAETARSRMLRYGWLRIYVTPQGEIWYVGRKYK
jgi:hypothetical protein